MPGLACARRRRSRRGSHRRVRQTSPRSCRRGCDGPPRAHAKVRTGRGEALRSVHFVTRSPTWSRVCEMATGSQARLRLRAPFRRSSSNLDQILDASVCAERVVSYAFRSRPRERTSSMSVLTHTHASIRCGIASRAYLITLSVRAEREGSSRSSRAEGSRRSSPLSHPSGSRCDETVSAERRATRRATAACSGGACVRLACAGSGADLHASARSTRSCVRPRGVSEAHPHPRLGRRSSGAVARPRKQRREFAR